MADYCIINKLQLKVLLEDSVEGLLNLVEMAKGQNIRTRIWKRYSLEDSRMAIEKVFDKNKEGRIIIENYTNFSYESSLVI